jgi:hypothetical protein
LAVVLEVVLDSEVPEWEVDWEEVLDSAAALDIRLDSVVKCPWLPPLSQFRWFIKPMVRNLLHGRVLELMHICLATSAIPVTTTSVPSQAGSTVIYRR